MQNLNELRRLAGLPLLEKEGHFEPLEGDEPKDAPKGDEPKGDDDAPKKEKKGGKEGEDEPTFPEVVTAMAAKMEGKTGDELIELVAKLYDAGVKDGVEQAKAEMEDEEGKGKEKKDDEHEDDVPPPPVDELPSEEEMKNEAMIKSLRRMINY